MERNAVAGMVWASLRINRNLHVKRVETEDRSLAESLQAEAGRTRP